MAGDSAQEQYSAKLTTAEEAVAPIAAGEYVSCAMAVAQPPALLSALADRLRSGDLSGIRLYYKFALDPLATTLLADDVIEKVDAHTMFIHGRDHELIKGQIKSGRKVVSYVPVHFSQVPRVFEDTIDLDTFLVTVSPMDRGGYFSFGTNNDFTSVAARRAKRLIVEVNPNMPRVFGQSLLHVSEVSAIIENDVPLLELGSSEPSEEGTLIGEIVAPMIPDGSTIQLGIGKLLTGVARALSGHSDLGLHSELFTPAIAELVQKGVLTGRRKNLHQHKHVFTFAVGTADTYEFMNDNAAFESHPSSYVNDVRVIAANDNLVSVNTAIEIDLYGQVNAEFIAGHEFSGSGGQFDFVKGASMARNGRSIVALPSTARKGTVSSIVPKVGMVTDIRNDVEWVVTEFGAVNLRGRSTKERAEALISIAHPDFRAELTAAARGVTLI
ncbi:acetyl-CoA hydrolase/transferase family protein [Mycolicibacterium palauense]|uniref:acetyl-CoA hydrolase/transferase family protein n=1 Tax=Mycolicibacterium palauense TaxID=2034511 RepID=UPI001C3F3E55|nr:acetyl-CoA hydrolase/transferase C-terminal domain-containing protein [Mycolicibacterium palauense]